MKKWLILGVVVIAVMAVVYRIEAVRKIVIGS